MENSRQVPFILLVACLSMLIFLSLLQHRPNILFTSQAGRQANSSHLYGLNSLGCRARLPQSQHTACHLAGGDPGTRPPAEVRPVGARSPDGTKGNSLLGWEQLRPGEHWRSCRPAPAPALRNVEPLRYAMRRRAHVWTRTNTQGHTSARRPRGL